MENPRKTGLLFRAGLVTALASALAFVAVSAHAVDPMPPAPVGAYGICTMSGATLTGREWAALMPARPGFCSRLRLGGEAPPGVTHCGALARSIGCIVVD
jgi:hypothetical protein